MVKVKAEIYSRVSGYFRPVAQWNKGKQEEFKLRRILKVDKANAESNSCSERQ